MSDYAFFDRKPEASDVLAEVLAGLSQPAKHLSPKYFYDEAGSKLFEAITELPEYYLTRTELGIFDQHEVEMQQLLNRSECIVEYGSGSNRKIKRLLEIADPGVYVPIDISAEHLQANARALQAERPSMSVYPVCADFTQIVELPEQVAAMQKTAFFPGSSIGNFDPAEATRFLANVAATVGVRGQLLIGVDCKKAKSILEPAYDDAQGVTKAFNLNMLEHLNETLGATFDVSGFDHEAVYNETLGRIEMYLVAERAQSVGIGGQTIEFERGERIHTESSYKYAPEEFLALAREAGFSEVKVWQDENNLFAVYLLSALGS